MKMSLLQIVRRNRSWILSVFVALFVLASSNQLFAGWDWPWRAGALKAEAEQARESQVISEGLAQLEQQKAHDADRIVHIMAGLLLVTILAATVSINYLRNNRTIVQKVVKNEIVQQVKEKEVAQKVVQEVIIVRSPAHEIVTDSVVIDGTNVIWGTPSNPTPSFLNVIALLLELQKRQCAFKCYFDANTRYTLKETENGHEASVFSRLCRDFPNQFIVVPGRTRADDFVLDYAHSHGTPIISNDQYNDYQEKYSWLNPETKRRASFVIHSGMIQIVPMGIQSKIPDDLEAADSALRAGFGKPVFAKALAEPNDTGDHAKVNGAMVLAPA